MKCRIFALQDPNRSNTTSDLPSDTVVCLLTLLSRSSQSLVLSVAHCMNDSILISYKYSSALQFFLRLRGNKILQSSGIIESIDDNFRLLNQRQ
jgi:hypothetical protein